MLLRFKNYKIRMAAAFAVVVIFITQACISEDKTINNKGKQSMEQYIDNFNLEWNTMPELWEEGAFNGNGRLGVMVWKDYSGGLRFDIGDSKLYDQRNRVPSGKFILNFKGKAESFKMTQKLFSSEIVAEIKTDMGTIKITCFSDMNYNAVRVTAATTGDESVTFKHIPLPAANPNLLRKQIIEYIKPHNRHIVNDLTNPEILGQLHSVPVVKELPEEKITEKGNITFRNVPFPNSGGYCLIWQENNITPAGKNLIWTVNIYDGKLTADKKEQLLSDFDKYLKKDEKEIIKKHLQAWKEYYQGAFISIPDKELEANFWIELYKVRAAASENEYPIDLLGPWFRSTPWPRIWCNLNVQLTYPIAYQTGKFKVANSLFKTMDEKIEHFINAVPEKFRHDSAAVGRGWSPASGTSFWGEYGNFLWMLFTYERFLNFHPDRKRKNTKYYTLLKKGLNFIIHNLQKDEKGILHFPPDFSPEYKLEDGTKKFPDTNYNIAFTDWALDSVLNIAEELNDTEVLKKYSEIKKHLIPIRKDKYGYMVAAGIPMNIRHRHFSHMAEFYPTAMLNTDTPESYNLAEKSVERWLTCPQLFGRASGYTYTAASAMYSRLHEPEKAFEYIKKYIRERSTPNTFYLESGPCIETPLHSASATIDMLMHSINMNEARVFLGIPSSWSELSFSELPVLGGHVISAELKDHKISFIKLKCASDNTKVSVVIPASLNNNLNYIASGNTKISTEKLPHGLIKISALLQKNEYLTLGKDHDIYEKIKVSPDESFHFGLN